MIRLSIYYRPKIVRQLPQLSQLSLHRLVILQNPVDLLVALGCRTLPGDSRVAGVALNFRRQARVSWTVRRSNGGLVEHHHLLPLVDHKMTATWLVIVLCTLGFQSAAVVHGGMSLVDDVAGDVALVDGGDEDLGPHVLRLHRRLLDLEGQIEGCDVVIRGGDISRLVTCSSFPRLGPTVGYKCLLRDLHHLP